MKITAIVYVDVYIPNLTLFGLLIASRLYCQTLVSPHQPAELNSTANMLTRSVTHRRHSVAAPSAVLSSASKSPPAHQKVSPDGRLANRLALVTVLLRPRAGQFFLPRRPKCHRRPLLASQPAAKTGQKTPDNELSLPFFGTLARFV